MPWLDLDPTWDSRGTTPMPKTAQDTTINTFERVGQVEYAWVPGGIPILVVRWDMIRRGYYLAAAGR